MLAKMRTTMRLALLFLFSITATFAQNANLSGLITDASSASVPHASVTITAQDTGTKRETTSNDRGLYIAPSLEPGLYTVTVQAPGFQTASQTDLKLDVAQNARLDFKLEVGSIEQKVIVQGGAPLVNTESAAVSTVVDRKFVENIPLNGRSFQSLISLTPGVVAVPAGTSLLQGQFSVNGQRAAGNAFMVDGVSANFGTAPNISLGPQFGGNLPGLTTLGTTQSLVSVDAMQEFRVQTSTYAAEYGDKPGGQISIATRSGTNQFHGSFFEYFRNDVLDANDWFANRSGLPKTKERQNDFGGTLGGPVVIPSLYTRHDKTFFFFSYEGLRLRQPQFQLTNVPTLALRQQAPVAVQPILNAFPLANGRDLGNGLAELNAGYSDPSSLDATSVRIDHNINSKLTVFGRYSNAPSRALIRSTASLSRVEHTRIGTQTLTLGATLSPTLRSSNDFKLNFSANPAYDALDLDSFGGAVPPPRSAIVPSQYDSPTAQAGFVLLFAGRTSVSIPQILMNGNIGQSQHSLQLLDNFSYVVGSHQLKLGVGYRRLTPDAPNRSYLLSAFFASSQEVLNATAGSAATGTVVPFYALFTYWSLYGQDTWKLSRRLNLDMGLRWEVSPPPGERNGLFAPAVDQISNLATMQLVPGVRQWKTRYDNFAPRVGVAYQLFRVQSYETVLRGGFGVFYDSGNDFSAGGFSQWPFSTNKSITNLTFPLSATQAAPPTLPNLSNPALPTNSPLYVMDPNLKLPYTLQWNAAVGQSLGKNQSLTVSYVGAAGKRLAQRTQQNLAAINPSFQTTVSMIRNSATSDYDALQVQFQRRLSRGLQALASYTWSHGLDDDSTGFTGVAPLRGNADFDVRQLLAGALTFDIPAPGVHALSHAILGGWSVDTNLHIQTGFPADLVARTFNNPADGSLVNARPNVNPGVPFYLTGAACTASNGGAPCPGGQRINPAAFNTNIPANQSGNLGRNQVRGLGAWQQDFAVRRQFALTEKLKVQFRAEAFNLFNHPNFGAIQRTLTSPTFGQPTNMLGRQLGGLNALYQIGGPRSLQFALKVLF